MMKPLPFGNPEHIVGLRETLPDEGSIPVAYRTFAEWRDRNTVFEHVAGAASWEPNLEGGDEPIRISATRVSGLLLSESTKKSNSGSAFASRTDS